MQPYRLWQMYANVLRTAVQQLEKLHWVPSFGEIPSTRGNWGSSVTSKNPTYRSFHSNVCKRDKLQDLFWMQFLVWEDERLITPLPLKSSFQLKTDTSDTDGKYVKTYLLDDQ